MGERRNNYAKISLELIGDQIISIGKLYVK